MNKEIKQILQSLGLEKEEIAVYLAGLELGEESVQNLAKKAGTKRPTTYKIIESLIEKGLVYQTFKGKKRLFGTDSPEKMLISLRQKERDFQKILPELNSIYNYSETKPKIKFYEGISGAIAVYEDTLKSTQKGETILTYTNIERLFKFFPKGYAETYFKRRIENNVKAKVIALDSPESREWKNNASKELRDIILAPKENFDFFGDTEIYANKVALISYQENFLAIIIESETIANMHRFIFNLAWNGLKSRLNGHIH